MFDKKISVIVPVYKVEHYLRRCVDSILEQTHHNLELILVNDGSPDNSGEICNYYKKQDERVIVIHKKNEGSSCARNAGLDIASGAYIAFVDSDDFIEKSMFEKLISLSLDYNLEVVETASKTLTSDRQFNHAFVVEDQIKAIERTIENTSFSVWRRIYKSSLVKNMRFIPKIIHQDVFYTMDVLNKIDKIGFLNSPLYIYNNLGQSIIRSNYSEHKIDIGIKATEYIGANLPDNENLKSAFNNYLVYYYTDHYFLLSRNTSIDVNGKYRKKIKNDIIKSLNKSNISTRTFLVVYLPPKVMQLLSSTYKFFKNIFQK